LAAMAVMASAKAAAAKVMVSFCIKPSSSLS
jgi:hypothetical protein